MARSDDRDILEGTEAALRPPPKLSLSEWADRYFYLSAESAAEPGRWRTLPYQKGIMDAITDPAVERVTWMKSARVGATKIMDATVGYYMHQDPCPILVVQPTVEDAQGYSKEEIAPMLRDCDVLAKIIGEPTAKISEQTILHKAFPGGSLSMVGANSPRGFRRVSRRVVIFDEVDGYPAAAGAEGDQIKLGIRRTEYYWNRKIIAASTPTIAGVSRIEPMFYEGDQRYYNVPCPHCDYADVLVFNEKDDGRGHFMRWPEGKPEEAHFICSENHCKIEHHNKRQMLELGEWIPEAEFDSHASFHSWAAYSLSPNASWGHLAAEFLEAKDTPGKLKTWVNTVRGETWQDRGEAPDWDRLYRRRESYQIGTVPEGVVFLTCGVDVQKDRFVYEVVGWGAGKESWSIDAGTIFVNTADSAAARREFADLISRTFPGPGGRSFPIIRTAVDSGYNTQQIYALAKPYGMNRVIACKGVGSARQLLGSPSPVDLNIRGQLMKRGYKVWPVGVSIAKSELYGWLRIEQPAEGEPYPPGWCHFPEHGEDYFKELTAEHLVEVRKKTGHVVHQWQMLPNRENHFLDCRIYARAAAAAAGIDRMRVPAKPKPKPKRRAGDEPAPPEEAGEQPESPRGREKRAEGWVSKGKKGRKKKSGKSWFGRRR